MPVRLFIGNLPYSATEAELREHLSTVGEPTSVVLPVDRETGRPRGFAFVDYVTKGSNILTEHYSAVQADVPDPTDVSTQINTRLIQTLENADQILIAGEARTHCLANTVRDIANNFGDDSFVSKLVLLTDASSDIPGFESHAQNFMNEMTSRGMQLSTTTEFLA